MNDQRRRNIQRICEAMTELREQLDSLKQEEQDAFDNMPDSLQAADKGQKMEGNVETLDEAVDSVDETITSLEGLAAK